MFVFYTTILLRRVSTTSLVQDIPSGIKAFYMSRQELEPIITSNDFNISTKLDFDHRHKILQQHRSFPFGFHQIHPNSTTGIINNSKKK